MEVDHYHRSLGWEGNGYHAIGRRTGHVEDQFGRWPTRKYRKRGAHVGDIYRQPGRLLGWNDRAIGYSLEGGLDVFGQPSFADYTSEQLDSARAYIDRVFDFFVRYGSHELMLRGHRDLIREFGARGPKACPCFDVRAWYLGDVDDTERPDDHPVFPTPGRKPSAVDLVEAQVHIVKGGDSLWRIAHSYGITLNQLVTWNDMAATDVIHPGDILRVTG